MVAGAGSWAFLTNADGTCAVQHNRCRALICSISEIVDAFVHDLGVVAGETLHQAATLVCVAARTEANAHRVRCRARRNTVLN